MTDIHWLENELGFYWENESYLVFFGKKTASLETLKNHYQDFDFFALHQVHGDRVVEATNGKVEADAQWTKAQRQALVIQTADCMPVILIHKETQMIGAAHAGWRGICQQIISKLALQMAYQGAQLRGFQAYIGPHILKDSFEVDSEVKSEILKSVPNMNDREMRKSHLYEDFDNGKTKIDLLQIAQAQLKNMAVPDEKIFSLLIDTKSDQRFHSHRRDKENAGRQLSFIVRK